ncbi:MAG: diphthine--ammonia ligase [Nitrososphaerales archaeon]
MKDAAVLFSGGKDSTYTIDRLSAQGYRISCLVTLFSKNRDSYMLHTASIQLAELCSKALEIPIVIGYTNGNKEEELEDIADVVRSARAKYEFDALGCGGIASNYQKVRIEKIATELGLKAEAPLWGIDQGEYVQNLIESGYRFILTSVSAAGLDAGWLGKEIDQDSARALIELSSKFRFNAALEGGEGETLVLDCPIFPRNRIRIVGSRKIWNGYQGRLEIMKAELERKPSNQVMFKSTKTDRDQIPC